jgi:hypothetical protein
MEACTVTETGAIDVLERLSVMVTAEAVSSNSESFRQRSPSEIVDAAVYSETRRKPPNANRKAARYNRTS